MYFHSHPYNTYKDFNLNLGVDGVVGLGPGGNESIVTQLLAQGKIDKGIVSLDLTTDNKF